MPPCACLNLILPCSAEGLGLPEDKAGEAGLTFHRTRKELRSGPSAGWAGGSDEAWGRVLPYRGQVVLGTCRAGMMLHPRATFPLTWGLRW